MTCKRILATLLFAMTVFAGSSDSTATVSQIGVTRIDAEVEIGAPPGKVWAFLTKGTNLATWCSYWKNTPVDTDISMVGDVLDFTDDWGNGGRSIVTYYERNKELRVSHEPTNGSYMCQSKVLLTPTESGTRVRYVEQYTDESKPEDRKATAAKMEAIVNEALAALKSGAEAR